MKVRVAQSLRASSRSWPARHLRRHHLWREGAA